MPHAALPAFQRSHAAAPNKFAIVAVGRAGLSKMTAMGEGKSRFLPRPM
jgi:hypothetical protein